MISDVARNYISLRQFAKTYLGDYDKSIFAKIRVASNTLVAIFDQDFQTLTEDLSHQMAAYNSFYKKNIQLMLAYILELQKDLQELSQMLLMTQQGAEVGKFLKTVCVGLRMKCTLAQINLDRFRMRIENRTLLVADIGSGSTVTEFLKFVPANFVGKRPECKQDMKVLSEDLAGIAKVFEATDRWGSPSEISENQTMREQQVTDIKPIESRLKKFLEKSDIVSKCLTGFSEILEKIITWKETAQAMTREILDESSLVSKEMFDFKTEVKDVENDEKEIEKLVSLYGSAKISKMDLLNRFDPDEHASSGDRNAMHVNTFVGRIHTHLTEPLRLRIHKIRKDLQSFYDSMMLKALNLDAYLEPHTFYLKASKMKIWRLPMPNLEKPKEIHDQAREFWKVWSREVTMKQFVQNDATKFIAEGLSTFSTPLLNELDKFEQQLQLNKEKLLLSIQRMQTCRKEYLKKQVIDHNFVL